jgi:hypothetical protein
MAQTGTPGRPALSCRVDLESLTERSSILDHKELAGDPGS